MSKAPDHAPEPVNVDAGTEGDEKITKAENDKDGIYAAYAEYAKQLRTWLVTFGLGGPVLFFTKPELFEKLNTGTRSAVIWAFLFGCALQIFLVIVNKYINWINYNFFRKLEKKERSGETLNRNLAEVVCGKAATWIWLDFMVEAITVGVFAYAVFHVTTAGLALVEPAVIHTGPGD